MPINPSLLHYVAISLDYDDDAIEQSGIAGDYRKAMERVDRVLSKGVEVLRPLSISENDLWEIASKKASEL